MLCLKRSPDESVNLYLGERFLGSLMVLEVDRGAARLGFEMAKDVIIVRHEVDARLRKEAIPGSDLGSTNYREPAA